MCFIQTMAPFRSAGLPTTPRNQAACATHLQDAVVVSESCIETPAHRGKRRRMDHSLPEMLPLDAVNRVDTEQATSYPKKARERVVGRVCAEYHFRLSASTTNHMVVCALIHL
jgi:hypothetical protein